MLLLELRLVSDEPAVRLASLELELLAVSPALLLELRLVFEDEPAVLLGSLLLPEDEGHSGAGGI